MSNATKSQYDKERRQSRYAAGLCSKCSRPRSGAHALCEDHDLYGRYRGMIQRCHSPRHHSYKNYGARGIVVCQRWRDSYENFVSDMGRPPTPQHMIERTNNDGPYSPDNCKWSLCDEQNRNRRVNRLFTYNGVTKCLMDWCIDLNLNNRTVAGRLRRGLSFEQAITGTAAPHRFYRERDIARAGSK